MITYNMYILLKFKFCESLKNPQHSKRKSAIYNSTKIVIVYLAMFSNKL